MSPLGSNLAGRTVKIGTHDGTFHADETLACAMLKMLPRFKDADIIRTRNPEKLAECDIVVDVGGEYNPEFLRFDHHQRTFDRTLSHLDSTKKSTIKLSSAGLVYHHFGREIIATTLGSSEQATEKVFDKVYEGFIKEIDAIDNGVNQFEGVTPKYNISTNLSSRVSNLSPNWNDAEKNFDAGFYKAVELTGTEFLDKVNYFGKVWWAARDLVSKAYENRFQVHSSGQIVEFSEGGVPWKEHLLSLEDEQGVLGRKGGDADSEPVSYKDSIEKSRYILYVIYTDQSGMWRIQCVPIDPKSFENRLSLPEAWRGVRDSALDEVSKIPGCTFVHAGGFIGGNKTTDGVLAMAEAALKQQSAL